LLRSKVRQINDIGADMLCILQLPLDRAAGLAINPMNQPYLSRIALCGYRQLLANGPGPERWPDLPAICRNLCGSPVAERLLADLDLLQNKGLDELDTATRDILLGRYAMQKSNPYAQEIVAWLRGEYEFDPQCLTD
jgi:hyaluronoglucosaminidase